MKKKYALTAVMTIVFSLSSSAQRGDLHYFDYMLGQQGIYRLDYVPAQFGLNSIPIPDTIAVGHFADIGIAESQAFQQLPLLVIANDSLFLMDGLILHPYDTIPDVFAENICACDSFVVVASNQAPFLRAFTVRKSIQAAFQLDTSKIPFTPNHMACHNGKVYAAVADKIVGVDLLLQDTIGSAAIPDYFWGSAIPMWFIPMDQHLYIDIEYATALVRFTLMRMDYNTFTLDSILHREGLGNYAPPLGIPNEGRIMMLDFPSQYVIADDSLYVTSQNPFPNLITQTYAWNTAPVVYHVFDHLSKNLYQTNGSTITDSLQFNESIRISYDFWFDDLGFDNPENTPQIHVYPNPSTGNFLVESLYPLLEAEVIDISGRNIRAYRFELPEITQQIDLTGFSRGIYILRTRTGEGISSQRLIIH